MANRGRHGFSNRPPSRPIPLIRHMPPTIPLIPMPPDPNPHIAPWTHGRNFNGFNFSPMRYPVKRLNHQPALTRTSFNKNKNKGKYKDVKKKQSIPGVQFKNSSPINGLPKTESTITIKNSNITTITEPKKNDVNSTKKQEDVIGINQNNTVQVLNSVADEAHSSRKREVIEIESDTEDDKHKAKRPCTLEASNSDNKTKEIPAKYILHLTSAIQNYFDENVQTAALFKKKTELRDGIQDLIRKQTGMEGILHMTGSSMSGFGSLSSDVDMALVFDPNVNGISKGQARKAISRIAGSLKRQAFCRDVEMIFAKVPIVKFYDTISRCEVDININNTLGIKNSFLLRAISLVDPRIPPLVVTIKCWAKSHNINSAFDGSLSSYCIVTMIIYFLQTGVSPPVLPPLKQSVDRLQTVNVNRQLQNFVPKDFIKFENRNKEPVGQLFVTFFKFWAKKFRQNKIHSVYTATERLRSYNEPELDRSCYHLVMEEPFQKDNIARALRANNFTEIKDLFQKMLAEFKEIVSFEQLFSNNY